jgi:chitodextrinase
VTSVDSVGNESAKSTAINVTTLPPPDTTAPSIPSDVQLQAGNAQVSVSWAASTDNVSVSGYNIYRNGTKVNASLVSSTSYTDTGLVNGVNYTYQVSAVDSSGNQSAKSSPITIKPTDQMAVRLIPNKFGIYVQITNGVAPFTVEWDLGIEEVNASAYLISGLTAETEYTVTVTDSLGVFITQTINTGSLESFLPPVFPSPEGIFQQMIDNFGEAGTVAIAIVGAAVALGILCILGLWGWRLSKRWLSATK